MKTIFKKIISNNYFLRQLTKYSSRTIILRYHSVKEDPTEHDHLISPGIVHSKKIFLKQMELIARNYHPISMDDLSIALSLHKKLPPKAVVVTFDDGYADNDEIVSPVLNSFGISGTFYLTVGAINTSLAPWYVRIRFGLWKTPLLKWINPHNGKKFLLTTRDEKIKAFIEASRDCALLSGSDQLLFVDKVLNSLQVVESGAYDGLMLSWDQVKALAENGHIVGSHTLTHPNLNYSNGNDLNREIVVSKKVIEDHLGFKIKHFCYPNPALTPNFNSEVIRCVRDAGYETSVTSISGGVTQGSNPYALPRMSVPYDIDEFQWCLESSFMGRVL